MGRKGGFIQVELTLGRPLCWFICMLHTNKLPLWHLFAHLDGPTSGANSFTSPIGKNNQYCNKSSIIQFRPFVCDNAMPVLNEDMLNDLSSDQKYLYGVVHAIRSRNASQDLSVRKPGPLNHARWVTLANRVCRLYISTDSPTKNLCTITHFIVTNYAPNWFLIKQSPLCTDGAKHVYLAKELVKVLSGDIRAIVDHISVVMLILHMQKTF